MTRLNPGAGVIIFLEPECSPQVMTAITTSSESSQNQTEITVDETTGLVKWSYFINCEYFRPLL
jgi:hypothetical protein